VVALNVKEQRLSNLIQGLLVAACLGASPVVRRIPKSVLWGYFAYMSLESLPGSEFWDRILLALTDKRRRCDCHAACVRTCRRNTGSAVALWQALILPLPSQL
jgi:boron transporter